MVRQLSEKARHMKAENAKKSREAVWQLFPNEKWITIEDGIYLSSRRPIGEKSGYKDELKDAQVLKSFGSTVYLVPESRSEPGKKYDAVVNGQKFEFKNMKGASVLTLKDHFLRSRKQAPNVFINLEQSPLSKHDIMRTLYGARNSSDYAAKNAFNGGMIILKIKEEKRLVYLKADTLKAKNRARARPVCWRGEVSPPQPR